jgi:hypothetical protein
MSTEKDDNSTDSKKAEPLRDRTGPDGLPNLLEHQYG